MQKAQYLSHTGDRVPAACSAQAGPSAESGLNLPSGHKEKQASLLPGTEYQHPFPTGCCGVGVQWAQGKGPNGDRFQTPAVPLQIINYRSFSLYSPLSPPPNSFRNSNWWQNRAWERCKGALLPCLRSPTCFIILLIPATQVKYIYIYICLLRCLCSFAVRSSVRASISIYLERERFVCLFVCFPPLLWIQGGASYLFPHDLCCPRW